MNQSSAVPVSSGGNNDLISYFPRHRLHQVQRFWATVCCLGQVGPGDRHRNTWFYKKGHFKLEQLLQNWSTLGLIVWLLSWFLRNRWGDNNHLEHQDLKMLSAHYYMILLHDMKCVFFEIIGSKLLRFLLLNAFCFWLYMIRSCTSRVKEVFISIFTSVNVGKQQY